MRILIVLLSFVAGVVAGNLWATRPQVHLAYRETVRGPDGAVDNLSVWSPTVVIDTPTDDERLKLHADWANGLWGDAVTWTCRSCAEPIACWVAEAVPCP